MPSPLKIIPLMMLASLILVAACSTPVAAPEIGELAPSFELTSIDGESVSLSDFRGKPVLINFWTTWCPPCRLEMPYIQEVYDEWSERGLVVLAINIGESPSQVEAFVRGYDLTFPTLLDVARNVAKQYNIRGIPTTYFVDSRGIIQDLRIGRFLSVAEIEEMVGGIFP